MNDPIDVTFSMTLREYSSLNRRVGFLEGAMIGLRLSEDVEKSLDSIDDRYREICGDKPKDAT